MGISNEDEEQQNSIYDPLINNNSDSNSELKNKTPGENEDDSKAFTFIEIEKMLHRIQI